MDKNGSSLIIIVNFALGSTDDAVVDSVLFEKARQFMRNRTWMWISCLAITAVLQGIAISKDQQVPAVHRPSLSISSAFELETRLLVESDRLFELSMAAEVSPRRQAYEKSSLLPELSEDFSWESHPDEAMEQELEEVLKATAPTESSTGTELETGVAEVQAPVETVHAWHTVKTGETLSSIAKLYNITVSALVLYNGLSNPNVIRPGFRLQLNFEPEFDHTVHAGESLWSIAQSYGLSLEEIKKQNPGIDPSIRVGQKIHVRITDLSEENMQRVLMARNLSGRFMWPARGRVSDRFGWRVHPITRRKNFHKGLDIAAPTGTKIQAARSGRVVFAGALKGYGNIVILDHGGGLKSRYAHCSKLHVKRGQHIRQGQKIAEVGATGMATGPHLHFEIRRQGDPLNPKDFL